MANRTWNGSTTGSFIDPLNWENGVPVDGDTIWVKYGSALFGQSYTPPFPVPTYNQPSTGTYHFYIDKSSFIDIADFVDGGQTQVANVGDITVDGGYGSGPSYSTIYIFNSADCNSVTVIDGGTFLCIGPFTVANGVTVNNGTFSANNTIADIVFTGDGDMSWSGGVIGSFDAGGNTVAHSSSIGSSLVYISNGNFDLGGNAIGLEVDVRADVTMFNDAGCGELVLTSGSFDLADNLLRVAGITQIDGILTTTTDYGGTIDYIYSSETTASVRSIVASKWINILNAIDGGRNNKLLFPLTHAQNRTVAEQSGIILDPRPVVVPTPPDYTIGLNLTTQTTTSYPPDTNGAVGPDHIVQAINGDFSVYDKTDGTVLRDTSLTQFFIDSGGGVEHSAFDPRIAYDPIAERFYVIAADGRDYTPGGNLLIAVSSSSDATAAWTSFKVDVQGGTSLNTHWVDFPILGYNNDVVSVIGQLFDKDALPNYGQIPMVYVFPKADLLLPIPSVDNVSKINVNGLASARQTPIFDPGNSMPHLIVGPSFSNFYVNEIEEDGLGSYTVSSPHIETLGTGTDWPLASGSSGRQPDGVTSLSHISTTSSGQSSVRVGDYIYGGYSTRVAAGGFVTDSAIVFFQLNAITQLLESTTIIHYSGMDMIYNSVAVNSKGRIVIGFTGSGPEIYPNAYCVVGRLANDRFPPFIIAGAVFSDPIQLSFNTQTHLRLDSVNRNRWGDYSSTVVDPVDENHFWTFQEYPLQGSNTSYRIKAAEIILG